MQLHMRRDNHNFETFRRTINKKGNVTKPAVTTMKYYKPTNATCKCSGTIYKIPTELCGWRRSAVCGKCCVEQVVYR